MLYGYMARYLRQWRQFQVSFKLLLNYNVSDRQHFQEVYN